MSTKYKRAENMIETELPFKTCKHNNWVDTFTINQIRNIKPGLTYDVGIGDGFYGNLLKFIHPNGRIIGIELNKKWVMFCEALSIYEQIIHVNILDFMGTDCGGDLIIFGDVLEHMVKDEMSVVLENAVLKFRWVLINGPIGFQVQEHEDFEEIHRCGITKNEDLIKYNIVEYNELDGIMMNCLIRGALI